MKSKSSTTSVLLAVAVLVALVGGFGIASADVNTSASGEVGDDTHTGHMVEHMDEEMFEWMQGHMSDHDHEHHAGGGGHC